MEFLSRFAQSLVGHLGAMTYVDVVKMLVMWLIGGTLIYLAIKKDMEPTLLLPMGFGAILVNLPLSGVIDQYIDPATGIAAEPGALSELFRMGIDNELFPLLLFIGIGAMIDFGPLLQNPKLLLFGAAAQFGIFFTVTAATMMGFTLTDAASIGIIGAADGPYLYFCGELLQYKIYRCHYCGGVQLYGAGAHHSAAIYQAGHHKKERLIRMKYEAKSTSKTVRILFPIVVTVIAGIVAPRSVALVGF